jgi:PhnB protein
MADEDRPADQIMHAALDGEVKLFGSDTKLASPKMKKVSLCLGGSDEAKLRKFFESLSEGGKVATPLEKMFWGDIFGTLADKYGLEWMVNISATKES